MIDGREALNKLAMNAVRFSGAARLVAPHLSGLGAILMLHRVSEAPQKPLGLNRHLAVAPGFLDALLAELKRTGYTFVGMEEIVEAIRAGGPRRLLALTADDAYRDNLTEALPVLESHGAPVTIYVCPGLTARRIDPWWDVLEDIVTAADRIRFDTGRRKLDLDCATPAGKRAAFARLQRHLTADIAEEERQTVLRDLAAAAGIEAAAGGEEALMGWDEVRMIARHRLVTAGAHTVHHHHLARLSEEQAYREISEAADLLAAETGTRPRHMAYPYGHAAAVGLREASLARAAGFVSAVTTRHGVLHDGHARHLHALPRVSLNGRYQRLGYVRTMLSGATTVLANRGRRLVTL